MAKSRGIRLQQYLDNWLVRAQSQKEAYQTQGYSEPFFVNLTLKSWVG